MLWQGKSEKEFPPPWGFSVGEKKWRTKPNKLLRQITRARKWRCRMDVVVLSALKPAWLKCLRMMARALQWPWSICIPLLSLKSRPRLWTATMAFRSEWFPARQVLQLAQNRVMQKSRRYRLLSLPRVPLCWRCQARRGFRWLCFVAWVCQGGRLGRPDFDEQR